MLLFDLEETLKYRKHIGHFLLTYFLSFFLDIKSDQVSLVLVPCPARHSSHDPFQWCSLDYITTERQTLVWANAKNKCVDEAQVCLFFFSLTNRYFVYHVKMY